MTDEKRDELQFEVDVLDITSRHIAEIVRPLEAMLVMLGPLGFAHTSTARVIANLLGHAAEASVALDAIRGQVLATAKSATEEPIYE